MGVVANEPSMEDILSSIKRIIADGSERVAPARSLRRRTPEPDEGALSRSTDEHVDLGRDIGLELPGHEATGGNEPAILELTDMVEEPTEMNEAAATPRRATQKAAAQPQARPSSQTSAQPVAPPEQEDMILSDISTQATRHSLSQLSSLLVRPQEGDANTLEGLVREMLRPLLKDWLEANLPDLVQSMVKKEIDRIVGRLG
ncbi:MAG TPA: DUF2497 domain-containing protein [Sphingobium sp.]